VLTVGLIYTAASLMADISHALLNPRLRLGSAE
jgi:ABC-type dipeptide/oligopeptide/nickel transport system permease component